MLNRAPDVYIPVEPEDNGIAIPAVLSLIVHAAILVFIVFSHRFPDFDEPEPIETTLITPEELAAFQSNIAANREALAAQKNSQTVEVDSAPETATSSPQNTSEDITARSVPAEPQESNRFSSIFSAEDSTTEPTSETINPFGEETPSNDPINENADSNSADQSPVDETESDFASEDNPYANQPIANNADNEAIKKQLTNNIYKSIHDNLQLKDKNSKNTVYSARATIYLGASGEIDISVKPNNPSTPQDYIDSVKKAISDSHDAKTSLFKEAASLDLNPIILNFKS